MAKEKTYKRFSMAQRLEHWLLFLSFTTLAITGLPQKFPDEGWASTLIAWLGGIESVRVYHHLAAAFLLLEAVYHAVVVMYQVIVLRVRWSMYPDLQDVSDGMAALLYNLGLRKEPPKYDHFNFGEKAEYWALVWGTIIMAATGFMLWNPIITSRFVPGEFIPAAKAAHGAEAILAVLAILVWHIYNVHVKIFNQAMFTGKMAAHEMEEEHALELERLAKGEAEWKPSPEQKRQWQRVFVPVAAVLSFTLLFGVYLFLTAETTAVTTLPTRPTVQVFAPRTPTRAPTLAPSPARTSVSGQATAIAPQSGTAGAAKALPASHAGRTVCQVCHVAGVGGAPKNPPSHTGRLDAGCVDCHKPK